MNEEHEDGAEYLVTDHLTQLYKVVGETGSHIRVLDGNVPLLINKRSMKIRGGTWGAKFRVATAEDIAVVSERMFCARVRYSGMSPSTYQRRSPEWFVRLQELIDEPREESTK